MFGAILTGSAHSVLQTICMSALVSKSLRSSCKPIAIAFIKVDKVSL